MGENLATRADLQALDLQMAGRFEALYKHLWVMAVGIVGCTVALVAADSVTSKSREHM